MSDDLWLLVPAGQRAGGDFVDDTVRLRAAERGLTGRLHLAGEFPHQRVELVRDADPERAVNELYYRRGWTDGLPVVPPTLARVQALLAAVDAPGDELVGELEPLGGRATVEKIAANAVMAGCQPVHLPLVLTAVQALVEPDFNLRGVQTTDENVAPALLLSSPEPERFDVNDGFGALGPGWRGSAAIGRAVRFVMHNVGGGWPGAVSVAGLGQPARYTLCFAENERLSPWPPLRLDHGFDAGDTVLTVLRAESVINVTGGLIELASVMGSAASAFSMAYGGAPGVVVAPYTARLLAEQGSSKADVQCWLHERGRLPAAQFDALWIKRDIIEPSRWPAWIRDVPDGAPLPVVESPQDLTVVVAGGDLPIAQQAYLPTWGFPVCRIMRRVPEPLAA